MARLLLALALALLALAPPAAFAADSYTVSTHPYTFGQAPTFMPDGDVVVGKDFRDGNGIQVYRSKLDGSGRRCLTCEMKAPNNVPAPRPQGDWILFHSWNGHRITFGSPGYGGMGSELWVMRPPGPPKGEPTRPPAPHRARGGGGAPPPDRAPAGERR